MTLGLKSCRVRESLIVDFTIKTNLDNLDGKAGIIDAFFKFA